MMLLVLCEGNHRSSVNSHHKGQTRNAGFDVLFDVSLNKLQNKQLSCCCFDDAHMTSLYWACLKPYPVSTENLPHSLTVTLLKIWLTLDGVWDRGSTWISLVFSPQKGIVSFPRKYFFLNEPLNYCYFEMCHWQSPLPVPEWMGTVIP